MLISIYECDKKHNNYSTKKGHSFTKCPCFIELDKFKIYIRTLPLQLFLAYCNHLSLYSSHPEGLQP